MRGIIQETLLKAVVAAAILPLCLQAAELSWTSDLNSTSPSQNEPVWLHQLPTDKNKPFGEKSFEIAPPSTTSDLLITVTFNEKAGGFLKVFRTNASGSQVLSDNLYEGVDMPNQRSLLISQLVLKEKGTLTFQSGQEDLQIYSIRWEWLEPKVIAAANDAFSLATIDNNGKALTQDEVSGDPAPAPTDHWKGSSITAPLTERPERIEEGVEFQAELESVPQFARLEGWVAGLPLAKNLTIWVNGRPLAAGVEVPDFTDPGYQTMATGITGYIGWRKIHLWLPSDWLQRGVNKLQLSWGSETGESYPVAVKHLSLQLNFPVSAPISTSPTTVLNHSPLP